MKNLNITSFFILIISLTSCTREFDFDVDSIDKKLVIEGNISNENIPVVIRITKSGGYGDDATYDPVDNASITLNVDGSTYMIPNTGDGYYKFSGITPIEGKTYSLTVVHKNKTYTTSTIFPLKVKSSLTGGIIDGIYGYLHRLDLKFKKGDSFVRVKSHVNDHAIIGNFYDLEEHYEMYDGETIERTQYIQKLKDGNINNPQFFFPGDSVTTKVYSIDKRTFAYFLEYQDATGGDILFSTTPYNPASNFNQYGVYGYFGSYQVSTVKSYVQ